MPTKTSIRSARATAVVAGSVLVLFVGIFWYVQSAGNETPTANQNASTINSFDACAAAGYPVAESYPRQCTVGGRTFVEMTVQPIVTNTNTSDDGVGGDDVSDRITVSTPEANALIASPLAVRGEARGSWYFEAEFRIALLDADGTELGETSATADGDWMTDDFVPYTAALTFDEPTGATGTLVLTESDPSGSGVPAELRVPVQFVE